MDQASPDYGAVWSEPAARLKQILALSSPEDALRQALELGYFSQYSCYKNPQFVNDVVAWQSSLLQRQFGDYWTAFANRVEETASVPDATMIQLDGRRVTPDLLRNVWYVHYLRSFGLPAIRKGVRPNVLEIGSGSGTFARVLRAMYPDVRLWLTDIPESLEFAAIYLRQTFPDIKICRVEDGASFEQADVILVPLQNSAALKGQTYDLAVNIWSFGEMPNTQINAWFRLLQEESDVRAFFTMNAFLAPVTVDTIERAEQGNWLFQFDKTWVPLDFQVNPWIHRNPYIQNFYCGISLLACKGAGHENSIPSLTDVELQDWVGILAADPENLSRPESELERVPSGDELNLKTLLQVTEYIGRFELGDSKDSVLFKLWNHFRLTQSPRAGELLVCYLAMTGKTLLDRRCSKEEQFILKKIAGSKLAESYSSFHLRASTGSGQGAEPLENVSKEQLQNLVDEAIAHFTAGDYEQAILKLSKACSIAPQNGEAWYYLALSFKNAGKPDLGLICAFVYFRLGLVKDHYMACFEELAATFLESRDELAKGNRGWIADIARSLLAGLAKKTSIVDLASGLVRAGQNSLGDAFRAAARYFPL